MPASFPHITQGTVNTSEGNAAVNAVITFTNSDKTASDSATTDSNGEFLIDLANMGYTDGETFTYSVLDEFQNENFSGTFVVSGGSTDLETITLAVITGPAERVRDCKIFNIGGGVVSRNNPFPVSVSTNTFLNTFEKPLTTVIEYDSDMLERFIGMAKVGTAKSSAGWLIQKLTYNNDDQPTDIQFASDDFDQIWDSRESLDFK